MSKPSTSKKNAKDDPWSKLQLQLPDDVVASIQARLPLVSLLRSRAVCKAWNAAVWSPWLLQERLNLRGGERERMLCVVGCCYLDVVCCVYDRASGRWYRLQLPPWQGDVARGIGVDLPPASAGGNVLVSVMHDRAGLLARPISVIHMGNPVAGSWTSLPELPGGLMVCHVLGVFEDVKARCFKLVAMVDTRARGMGNPVSTYVFDSAVGSWSTMIAPLPGPDLVDSVRSDQGAFVGPMLYCVAGEQGDLMAYDLEQSRWSWLQVAKPRYFQIFYCNLINVRDRLLCVALCLNLREGITSMQIWELDFARMAWTAVDAMPATMYFSHFRRVCFLGGRFSFESRERIRVVAGQDSEVYIMHDRLDRFVAVDLRGQRAVWRWLPPCPYKEFDSKSVYRKSLNVLDPWLKFGSSKQG